ncbi:VOC family protein [Hasllibacter sp. MH4015]|uniref:VOC family protein n=1 Tax=Hasllibacter sp. MH4015 TaxID=2854029 RepID=UPI001CD2863E|nr:hypothetical protein [Hasllibacter sp. MH4015]
MDLITIAANLQCTDIGRSRDWYTTLFGREFDSEPMEGLLEWHHGESAVLQLFEQSSTAGSGILTLIVQDLARECERLRDLSPGPIEQGDDVQIARLTDPDGNTVVLVSAGA